LNYFSIYLKSVGRIRRKGDTMRFLLKENLCSKAQIESMKGEELFSCLLNVNEMEAKALFFLFDNPSRTPDEISEKMGRHRTTVQRGLSHLLNLGLVTRRSEGKKRGYTYRYSAVSKEHIKKMILAEMEEWCTLIRKRLG
jgi:predicted transcriptional regulator